MNSSNVTGGWTPSMWVKETTEDSVSDTTAS
jgi:hypothetical protein